MLTFDRIIWKLKAYTAIEDSTKEMKGNCLNVYRTGKASACPCPARKIYGIVVAQQLIDKTGVPPDILETVFAGIERFGH